jgi:hypothetical protein
MPAKNTDATASTIITPDANAPGFMPVTPNPPISRASYSTVPAGDQFYGQATEADVIPPPPPLVIYFHASGGPSITLLHACPGQQDCPCICSGSETFKGMFGCQHCTPSSASAWGYRRVLSCQTQ